MANRRATYHIKYKMAGDGNEYGIDVVAGSKFEAWLLATVERIPWIYHKRPEAAWCHSVTYRNGNRRIFKNTAERPY